MPCARESRGERDRVLLRDAGVDVALALRLREAFEREVADVAGDEHEVLSALKELQHRLGEFSAHGDTRRAGPGARV